MTIFQFCQFEHELFWRYLSRLRAFVAHCDYCVGKWEILDIFDEGVKGETCILLEYWGFNGKKVDEASYLLQWNAWDTFEFEKASRVPRYSFPGPRIVYSISFYAPFWCNLHTSSNRATNLFPYYACDAQPDFASPWIM